MNQKIKMVIQIASHSNFQVNRNKFKKGTQNVFERGKNQRKKESKSEKLMNGVAIWASWYRFRMDKFIEDYFGIKLKLFQIFLIYAMQHNNYFMYLASRGQGKSFISAIYAVARGCLYPNSIIVIASGTKSQSINVLKKIEELKNMSPNMDREIEELKLGSNDPFCKLHNGSIIRVVTSNDNARSNRAHVILVDEFRMVDFQVISKVLRKFLTTPRQAPFMSKPEYAHIQERNKEIYLSSCWFKSHWSWDRATTYFKSMVEGKKYFICSLPYQLPIKENLLIRDQVLDEMSEADFDPIGWEMEMQALWHGENESAFFNFEDFNKSRKLNKVFYPPEICEQLNERNLIPKKEKGEIRVISADIATMIGAQNDATAIFCSRLIPIKDGYETQLVYTETIEGGITSDQALRLNVLKQHFSADYLVLDTANAGIGIYDTLAQGQVDPETGFEYPPLSCMNDERLAERCIYPNADKAIYSIRANQSMNSDIAINMKAMIKANRVKLPIHEKECEDILQTYKGYGSLPEDIKIKFKLPYIHTSLLINESINLEGEINDQTGAVRLKEARNARKDRYSSFSYMLYFIDYLNRKNRKKKTDFNPAQLFMVRKGKLL